jgi:glycosyltransferase involved in cell wall biosynthesis
MSTDGTPEIIEQIKNYLGIDDDKISLTVNKEKMWEVRNIIEALKECESNDIVCRLDGDDWLSDTDALSIIDHRYKELKCGALWTAHRWSFSDHNISGPLPRNADPYSHPWVSSHLKTFRKSLIENVKDENFRGPDGKYFRRIGDQTIYLPVLHQAAGNWHFEPIVAYHYTIDLGHETFQTEDAKFQKQEGEFLRQRGFVT